MPYILRQIGTDGSLAAHFLKDGVNFETGHSQARIDQLNALNPDAGVWEVVEVSKDAVNAARELVYAAEISQGRTDEAAKNADLASAKTKLRSALLRVAGVDGLTADEIDEYLSRIQ